jgi:hypothetical protein
MLTITLLDVHRAILTCGFGVSSVFNSIHDIAMPADSVDDIKAAAERDKVHVKDVLGNRIVSLESRWSATLPEADGFNTWSFLVVLIKASLDVSSHQGLVKDALGAEIDLETVPAPGSYTWVLKGERFHLVAIVG